MTKVSELVSQNISSAISNFNTWGGVFYNAKDVLYGAKGDGTTDDYAALYALINTTINGAQAGIIFPRGTYKLSSSITFPSNITLFIVQGAELSPDTTKVVTINGNIDAGLYPIFTGAGTIVASIKNPFLFPQWWGALADGTTDDTLPIQACIDAAPAGSEVKFKGRFKVSQLAVVSRMDLTFTGPGQLIGSGNTITSTFALFYIDGSSRIKVRDLQITGMNAGPADRGFWINNCIDLEVSGNRITNFGQQAFTLYGGTSTTENANVIHDNYILGNNYGIKLESNAEYYHFYENRIYGNNYGLFGGFGNCRVDNNQVNNNVTGMYLDSTLGSNPDHTSISGNQFNHNSQIGLLLSNTVNGMQVTDNQMLSTLGGAWPTTGKPHSLVMINVKDIAFIGNRVDADTTTSSWIHVDGHNNCRYIGNTFYGGNFKEISAGDMNAFSLNRFLTGSILALFATTTNTIRSYDIENGVMCGDATSAINKITATLSGTWVNETGFGALKYWKDGEGCINIQGTVSGGVATSVIMVLPVNFRPIASNIVDIPCTSGDTGVFGCVRVTPNGNVQQLSGGTTKFTINGKFKP